MALSKYDECEMLAGLLDSDLNSTNQSACHTQWTNTCSKLAE